MAFGVGFFAVALAAGCAVGSDLEDTGVGELAATPSPSGSDQSVKIPDSKTAHVEEDSGPPTLTGDAGGDASDAGTDAGPGSPIACTATNACATSTNIGQVKGDNGNDVLSAQGSTSQWFTVRVVEDDEDVFPVSLRLRAQLVSPPGTNFDLFVYRPSDGKECSVVASQSTSTGTDSASIVFGEDEDDFFSNGSSDDQNVTVEVRHVSGTCSTGAKWTLTLNGNQ